MTRVFSFEDKTTTMDLGGQQKAVRLVALRRRAGLFLPHQVKRFPDENQLTRTEKNPEARVHSALLEAPSPASGKPIVKYRQIGKRALPTRKTRATLAAHHY